MGAETKIEWCDRSWSPWRGCTKVSAGCAHCYAETLSKRNPAVLGSWGKGQPRVKAKNWREPVKWNRAVAPVKCTNAIGDPFTVSVRPPTTFPSLCDWLDEEVPIAWLAEFLQLIHDTPNLIWLLLTKRPELFSDRLHKVVRENHTGADYFASEWLDGDAPRNVWIGTSVEDQANAARRIPELLRIPARGRFLSLEPLLGPVQLRDEWFGYPCHGCQTCGFTRGHRLTKLPAIDWLIIGGESGPGARPCNVKWVRSLVAQGRAAGVPTFLKQLGARCQDDPVRWISAGGGKLTHPKGGDPAEWPEDLRVREFPAWEGANNEGREGTKTQGDNSALRIPHSAIGGGRP